MAVYTTPPKPTVRSARRRAHCIIPTPNPIVTTAPRASPINAGIREDTGAPDSMANRMT